MMPKLEPKAAGLKPTKIGYADRVVAYYHFLCWSPNFKNSSRAPQIVVISTSSLAVINTDCLVFRHPTTRMFFTSSLAKYWQNHFTFRPHASNKSRPFAILLPSSDRVENHKFKLKDAVNSSVKKTCMNLAQICF